MGLGATVGAAVRDIIEGTERIRHSALEGYFQASRTAPLAGLLLAGRVDATFRLVVDTHESSRFLWFVNRERRPVADVSIQLALAPMPPEAPSESVAGDLAILAPGFLLPRSGARLLELSCTVGLLEIRFTTGQTMEVVAPGGQRDVIGAAYDGYPVSALSASWIVPLIGALADWRRDAGAGQRRRFNPRGQGRLGELLNEVAVGCKDVIDHSRQSPAQPSGHGTAAERLLPGAHTISEGAACIRAYLDNDGVLLTSFDTGLESQQIDLHVALSGAAPTLRFDLPDFLVDGPVHARLLAALGSERNLNELLKARSDVGSAEIPADALAAMLRDAAGQQRAVILRIRHKLDSSGNSSGPDSDLLLLEGMLGGVPATLLLYMDVRIPKSENLEPLIDNASLIAWRLGNGTWRAGSRGTPVQAWLYRLCRILFTFQDGMRAL